MATSQPSCSSRAAARSPTAPAPTITTRPFSSTSFASLATAVAAVVLQPLESSMTETLNGPKNACLTCSSTFSPAATLEPPTQTAIVPRSFGPRVKNADWTSPRTALGSIFP